MSLLQATLTSPTPQSSAILPPRLKRAGEISVEKREKASPVVSQSFEKSRYVKTNPSFFLDVFADSVASAPSSIENVSNR
jgi:hypothetical protein